MSEAIGTRHPRADWLEKATGAALYTDDLGFGPSLLHARLLKSPHAAGRIVAIDTSQAERLPGVKAVLTGRDCPRPVGFGIKDRWPYAREVVRYHGEPVAAVAAVTEAIAAEACRLIRVEYEPIEPVLDAVAAARPESRLVHADIDRYEHAPGLLPFGPSNIAYHGRLRKGDVDRALAASDIVHTQTYYLPRVHHVAIENHAAVVQLDGAGVLTLWTSAQGPHQRQVYFANWLGKPLQDVRVITPYIGGGFGGKSNTSVELFVVPLALKLPGRPVKLNLTREEEFLTTFTRLECVARVEMGATRDGRVTALRTTLHMATGAWADNGVGMADNARNSITGPYVIPNIAADVYCVYTNHPGAGSYRGYGATEVHWAIEQHVDELARLLGFDPLELRRRNMLHEGAELPTGGRMHATGLAECVDRVAAALHWEEPLPAVPGKARGRGVALTLKGPHGPLNLGAAAVVKLNGDGSADVLCGATEMGQGATSGLRQIAAAELGFPVEQVRVQATVDTSVSPYDWKSVGSRTLWMVGNAVRAAAADARRQMTEAAAHRLNVEPAAIRIADGWVHCNGSPRFPLLEVARSGITDSGGGTWSGPIIGRGSHVTRDITGQDPETGLGDKVKPYYTLGAQGVEVEVDPETGSLTILRAVACFDVGRAISPAQVEGQICGGMAQGLSTTWFEEMLFDGEGRLKNPSMVDYKIMTSADAPLQWDLQYVEVPQADGPFAARGIGEPPLVAAGAALGNAVRDALGVRFTAAPLSPERIALAGAASHQAVPGGVGQ